MKIGDKVKLKENWEEITDELDELREESDITPVGIDDGVDCDKTYIILDIDADGDVYLYNEYNSVVYSDVLIKV